jgi:hypothetical protein
MKRQDVFENDAICEADENSMKSGAVPGELAMYRPDPRLNKPLTHRFDDVSDVDPVEPAPMQSGGARPSRRWLALAALLFVCGMVGAVLWPQDFFHSNRDISQIGVPIGVPDAAPDGNVSDALAPAANQSEPAPDPAVAENASATEVAANNSTPDSLPVAETPADLPPSDGGNSTESTTAKTRAQEPVMSTAKHRLSSKPKKTRLARTQIYEPGATVARARPYRARVFDPRPDFTQVVVLPSGETVILAEPEPYPRRHGFIGRRRQFIPPSQPFLPYLGD